MSTLWMVTFDDGAEAWCAATATATIYTATELKQCGGWVSKGPNFAFDGRGRVFVVNACRGKGAGRLLPDDAPLEDEVDVAIALARNRTANTTAAATNASHRRGLDPRARSGRACEHLLGNVLTNF